MSLRQGTRRLLFLLSLLALVLGYLLLVRSGIAAQLADGETLLGWLQTPGMAGPVIIIALMTLAIVMSPLPSAPIALAAGAAYGHTLWTLYVVIGAELGALLAFSIARLLGIDVLRKWFGDSLARAPLLSPNGLMGVVFVSRLLPFISFDMVSYAAGLTSLSYTRFAIATLAGILPASFLLAHVGAEMGSGDARRIAIALLLLGFLSALIWGVAIWRKRHAKPRHADTA